MKKDHLPLYDIIQLLSVSPIDGRYREQLADFNGFFGEYSLALFRVIVELSWLKAIIIATKQHSGKNGAANAKNTLPVEVESFIANIINNFSPKDAAYVKSIEKQTHHDVKAIEYFIKEKLAADHQLKQYCELVHFGITSDDTNNLAYALMTRKTRDEFILPKLKKIIAELRALAYTHATTSMLARTHGQPATPTTVGKECAVFVARLEQRLELLTAAPVLGKFNGATGNYSALYAAYPECDWRVICKEFVMNLGLDCNIYTTQIEPHDALAYFCTILAHINTILIALCRDVWGYISLNYFILKADASSDKNTYQEIGSSTMPHKINPIDFENAEGNFGIANALLYHFATKLPISRWQRDLSDSTVMRSLGSGIAYTLIAYSSLLKGLNKLEVNREELDADLEQHWEVLGEAVQITMRRYAVPNAYEKLKELTRGQKVTKRTLHAFIKTLSIPEEAKKQLLKLTPHNYLGKAVELAREV